MFRTDPIWWRHWLVSLYCTTHYQRHRIAAIAAGILVCAIIFPLMLMSPDTSGGSKEFIRSTGIFLAVLSNICILHGWRSVVLWLDFDIDPEHHLNRKNAVIPMLSIVCSGQGSSVMEGESTGESDLSSADCKPFDAVKTRNLVSRRVICQDQVNYWSAKLHHTEAMMLAQAEDGATLRIRRIIPGRLEDQKERIPPQAIECDTPYRGRAVPAGAVSASLMSLDSRESTLRSGPNIGVEPTSPVDSDAIIPDPLPPSSSSSPSSIRWPHSWPSPSSSSSSSPSSIPHTTHLVQTYSTHNGLVSPRSYHSICPFTCFSTDHKTCVLFYYLFKKIYIRNSFKKSLYNKIQC